MRVEERIYRLVFRAFTIRIWAKANLQDAQECDRQQKELYAIRDRHYVKHTVLAAELAESFAVLPFCNAVEISDTLGTGVLIYPEWP